MNRSEALGIVREYVKNESLVRHMLAVEAVMRYYAELLGEDAEAWGLAGLLHDFDWEIHPTLETHPQAGAPILQELGAPEWLVRAVLSHAEHTGVPRQSVLEKALFACDEITGLVTAVALVRPSHSIHDVKVSSVKKKWKDRAFAAGANREEIEAGTAAFTAAAPQLDLDLWKHVGHVVAAMQRIAPELGLEGEPD